MTGTMSDRTILNNRYQIEETLGKGGMAIVYQARDLTLERNVAIKVLRQDFSKHTAFREHFRQEAKAAANLSHPNIVTVHDFGLDSERLFIIMEYVPGTDLKQYLASRGRISVDQTIRLMIQACAGVGYAHRAGLVHCDIKPQNLLITPDLRMKVVDFGIARALASIHPEEKAEVVWGSPHYFSPEQAAGLPPSQASDVYSLGIIMYEMLTGKLPFTAPTATEISKMHREVLPPAPRELNPSIPVELEQILLKVLSKEPSARYRTADQLGRVLMTWQQTSKPAGRDRQQRTSDTPSAAIETQPYQPPSTSPAVESTQRPYNPLDIDWITVLLALLALIALGGLVPFFLWVYFIYYPPIR
jgi:serine/threonine protein kinase